MLVASLVALGAAAVVVPTEAAADEECERAHAEAADASRPAALRRGALVLSLTACSSAESWRRAWWASASDRDGGAVWLQTAETYADRRFPAGRAAIPTEGLAAVLSTVCRRAAARGEARSEGACEGTSVQPLPAGEFTTAPGDRPQLSLSLGAGWAEEEASPDVVLYSATHDAYLAFMRFDSGQTPEELVGELEALDGLRIDDAAEAIVGGLPARRLAVSVTGPRPVTFYDQEDSTITYVAEPGWAYRLDVLSVGGRTVLVVVEAEEEDFAAYVREADRVLATLTFR